MADLFFDEDYYLKTYPEALLSVKNNAYANALEHWKNEGKKLCFSPNEFFVKDAYLQQNSDLSASVCPVDHWINNSDIIKIFYENNNYVKPLGKAAIKYIEQHLSKDYDLDKMADIIMRQTLTFKAELSNDALNKITSLINDQNLSEDLRNKYIRLLSDHLVYKINNEHTIDIGGVWSGIEKCFLSKPVTLNDNCQGILHKLAIGGIFTEIFEQDIPIAEKTFLYLQSLLVNKEVQRVSSEGKILKALSAAIDAGYNLRPDTLSYYTDLLEKDIFTYYGLKSIHNILESSNSSINSISKIWDIIRSSFDYKILEEAIYVIGHDLKLNAKKLTDDQLNLLQKSINKPQAKAVFFTLKEHIKNNGNINEELKEKLQEFQQIEQDIKIVEEECNKSSLAKTEAQLWQEITAKNNISSADISEVQSILSNIIKIELVKDINNWQKDQINSWRIEPSQVKDNLAEVLAVIKRALILAEHKEPRTIQLITTLLLYKSNTGRLAEVATGEGKSIIVAMLAAVRALEGHNVDIVTSSEILAKRDGLEHKKFYQMLGFLSGDNTAQVESGLKQCYRNKIVYGDVGSFIGDILRHENMDKNIMGDRKEDIMIVDEVDNMFIDQSSHIVMLSSHLSGFEFLEPLLAAIWSHLEQTVFQFEKYGNEVIWSEWQINAETKQLELLDKIIIEDQVAFLKEKLVFYINNLIKESDPVIKIPAHLKEFARKQVENWAASAIQAYIYEPGKEYSFIRSSDGDIDIGPIDVRNTGVIYNNMQLADGLHQFLQLKHHLKLTPENLVINFLSNKGFFQRYLGKIYGMTGTLGTAEDQNLLSKLYGVDFITIPHFKPKIFNKLAPIAIDENDWQNEVIENIINIITHDQRAVLLLTESIKQAEKFQELLKDHDDIRIYLYTDNNDPFQKVAIDKRLNTGDVVIATNLAGRGTDFKTSCQLEERGGLHVMFSFLPSNPRTEAQGFGRTARQGNHGSAQLIINEDKTAEELREAYPWYITKDNYSIKELIEWRDLAEEQRLLEDRLCQLEMLGYKDNLFIEFNKFLEQFKNKDKDPDLEYNAEVEQIRELWGLWLKDQLDLMVCNIKGKLDSTSSFTASNEKIEQEVKQSFARFKEDVLTKYRNGNLITNPSYLVIKASLKKNINELNKAIDLDPNFSFAAHYLKAQACAIDNYKQCVIDSLTNSISNIEKVIIPLYSLPINLVGIGNLMNNDSPLSKQFQDKIDILVRLIENMIADINTVSSVNGVEEMKLIIKTFTAWQNVLSNYDKVKDELYEFDKLGIKGLYEIGTYYVEPEEDFFGNFLAFAVAAFQIAIGFAIPGGGIFLSSLSAGLIVGGVKDLIMTSIITFVDQKGIDVDQYLKSKGIELAVNVIFAGAQTGLDKLGWASKFGLKTAGESAAVGGIQQKAAQEMFIQQLKMQALTTTLTSVAYQGMKVGYKKHQSDIEDRIRKAINNMLSEHQVDLTRIAAYDVWADKQAARNDLLSEAQNMIARNYQGKYRQVHQKILREVGGKIPVIALPLAAIDMADTLSDVLDITREFTGELGGKLPTISPSDQGLVKMNLKSKGFGPYYANDAVAKFEQNNIITGKRIESENSCNQVHSLKFTLPSNGKSDYDNREVIRSACTEVASVKHANFKPQTDRLVNDLTNILSQKVTEMVREGIFRPIAGLVGTYTWEKMQGFLDGLTAKQVEDATKRAEQAFKDAANDHQENNDKVKDVSNKKATKPSNDNNKNYDDEPKKPEFDKKPKPSDEIHEVKPGDTLSSIALKYKVSLKDLKKANPQLSDPNKIKPNDRINLPSSKIVPGDANSDKPKSVTSPKPKVTDGSGGGICSDGVCDMSYVPQYRSVDNPITNVNSCNQAMKFIDSSDLSVKDKLATKQAFNKFMELSPEEQQKYAEQLYKASQLSDTNYKLNALISRVGYTLNQLNPFAIHDAEAAGVAAVFLLPPPVALMLLSTLAISHAIIVTHGHIKVLLTPIPELKKPDILSTPASDDKGSKDQGFDTTNVGGKDQGFAPSYHGSKLPGFEVPEKIDTSILTYKSNEELKKYKIEGNEAWTQEYNRWLDTVDPAKLQGHHVFSNKNRDIKMHDIFEKGYFDSNILNDNRNIMPLPAEKGLHDTISVHDGRHVNDVIRELARNLDQFKSDIDSGAIGKNNIEREFFQRIDVEKQKLFKGEIKLNKKG